MKVKLLDRKESVKEIKKLIYYAKKELILISPYVDISIDYMEEIICCRAKEKALIFRDNQFIKDYSFLKENDFRLFKVKDLHSKVYLNENWVIFSSMNLYNYSMENNFETSVMIKREDIENTSLIIEILKNAKEC